MLKNIVFMLLAACGACVSASTAAPQKSTRKINIYNAYIFQGEHGTVIDNPDCPTGSLPIHIDHALDDSSFVKVLRYGKGKLGPSVKHVIIDGVIETSGEFDKHSDLKLIRVNSWREKIVNAQNYMELSEASLGCEKNSAHNRVWLEALQRKPQR